MPTASQPPGVSEETNGRRLQTIAELGRRAVLGADLGQLLEEIVSTVQEELNVDLVSFLELVPDGTIAFRAGAGWKETQTGQLIADVGTATPAAEVLLSQAPVLVEDLAQDDRFPGATLLRNHGVAGSANVPVLGRRRPLGVLGAHAVSRRSFSTTEVAFLQGLANVLASAIESDGREQQERGRYLQRAEQLMALGQVAAGVAHELRNPLTAVKGLIQVNLRRAAANDVPPNDLAVIEHEIRRMERTLQTFLDFARPPQLDRRTVHLADIVDRVFSLVKGRAWKQQVELILRQPDDTVRVDADGDQFQQLLLNLVLNSLDAMPTGGMIEVEIRPPRDGFVELFVRDTGPGVSPEVLPKVFETFVSSKETGVGLGLPVSKRIAEEHGGSLSTYNLPGSGACFVLRVPSVEAA